MSLEVPGGQFVLDVTPQLLERATHDDEILPDSILITNVLRDQKLLVEPEPPEYAVGTILWPHQPRHDTIHPAPRGEVEELTRDYRSKAQTLPGSSYDQPHLGHIVAPAVALNLEGPVSDNLVPVHHHHPFGPLTIELCGSSFDQVPPGHVGAQVDPVLGRQSTKEGIGTLHIVRTHPSNGDRLSILESHLFLNCNLVRRRRGCIH